ncbi:hypothetical protein BEP19_16530 [Ammoniphilus oxalaticus]|uniref:Cold-shock protein n=1 Tax=Ammoniphilus oxalaticus TaxID=66863 RepID=A0A419SQN2_9BACL|nr:cold-inducible protein YdjO-related protein [Ammoniphilus oxalaticus]RKD26802.1 hypothetical protein BEP19_16530 [Ammoniphilus oxalaticus]
MFFNRRKEAEPIEEVMTDIWDCVTEDCSGWARKDFSFSSEPVCPFCEGAMIAESKMLPVLNDRIQNR